MPALAPALCVFGRLASYNRVLPTRVHPFKGGGYYSIHVLPWFPPQGRFNFCR